MAIDWFLSSLVMYHARSAVIYLRLSEPASTSQIPVLVHRWKNAQCGNIEIHWGYGMAAKTEEMSLAQIIRNCIILISLVESGAIDVLGRGHTMTDEGKKCPQCGVSGKGEDGEHETAVHTFMLNGATAADVGWKCWSCGHGWGFDLPFVPTASKQ
jgi:hypothetical protein